MRKIALLHFAYPPNVGGVEIMLKEQARILSDEGFDVLLVTGFGKEENKKIKLAQVKEFQSIYNFNPTLQKKILEKGIIDDQFYQLASTIEKKLRVLLKDRQVVIVHNMLSISRNLPFVYAFKNYVKKNPEKKFIVWVHDHMFIGEEKIKRERLVEASFERELLTRSIEGAVYVAISNTLAKLLSQVLKLPRKKIIVIPDGLNLKEFLEIDDLIWQICQKYQLFKRFPLILSPVNIIRRKNLEYSLAVISQLKKRYPKLFYLISGQVSYHKDTKKYLKFLKGKVDQYKINDRVLFLGEQLDRSLKDSEIHDLYQLADLVFYFSKSENFGLPILEASLSKTPIFVSSLKVFQQVGGENVKYIDFKKVKPREAAYQIEKFIKENKIIRANYRARTEFDLKKIVKDKLIPLLE